MPQSRVRFIFAYGTLMSTCTGAQGALERSLMEKQACLVGSSRIRAKLYEVGVCPGTTLGGARSDVVEGEVWELPTDHAALLSMLDMYEGCAVTSPTPYPYRRRRIRVRIPDGRRVTAWIYLWCGSTHGLKRCKTVRWREPARSVIPAAPGEARIPARPTLIAAE